MTDQQEKPPPPPHPPFPTEELPTTDELSDVPPLPPSGRLTRPLPSPKEVELQE